MTTAKKTAKKKRGRPAKRTVPIKKKAVAKKAPKKRTVSKKSLPASRHTKQCNICKSKHKIDIEAAYAAGRSSYQIAKMFPGITKDNVLRHVNYFNLNTQRKYKTVDIIETILERYTSHVITEVAPPSEQLVGQMIKLRAQLAGELVEKREETIDVRAKIQFVIDKRMENLCKRLGMSKEEIELLQPKGEIDGNKSD